MTRSHFLSPILLICLLLMTACGTAAPDQSTANESAAPVVVAEATSTPLPTDTPAPIEPTATSAPVEPTATSAPVEPTATPQPVAPPAPTDTPAPAPDWTQTASLVDGLYVRGNPNAPIRLIDYSDFF